jgi:ribosome-associated protein
MPEQANIKEIDFSEEFEFRTSRSGGSGGQHVNKVETRVELLFSVGGSRLLTEGQKRWLLQKLEGRLIRNDIICVVAAKERSQLRNKKLAVERFYTLLEKALRKPKVRKRRKMSKAAKEKRLKAKRLNSEKKSGRKKSIDY